MHAQEVNAQLFEKEVEVGMEGQRSCTEAGTSVRGRSRGKQRI